MGGSPNSSPVDLTYQKLCTRYTVRCMSHTMNGRSHMRVVCITLPIAVVPIGLIAQATPPHSDWSVSIGSGAIVVPRYAGAEQYQVWPMPMSQVTYRDRVYLGPSTVGALGAGLGAYVVRSGALRMTAEVGLGANRPARRADALAGMDDRDLLATAGASLTYDPGPVHGTIAWARGLNDHAGSITSARFGVTRLVAGHLMATTDMVAVFADARQMRREFGITDAEASSRRALLSTGDRRLRPGEENAYRPNGGLSEVGASVALAYGLRRRWSIVGFGRSELAR